MALTGAPDHLALDSSGEAAVEKGAYTTPASPAHSHARTLVRTHSGTVTSEPASLGIQIQFGCLPPPALQSSSPTSLPAPCSWFPFRKSLSSFSFSKTPERIVHCYYHHSITSHLLLNSPQCSFMLPLIHCIDFIMLSSSSTSSLLLKSMDMSQSLTHLTL